MPRRIDEPEITQAEPTRPQPISPDGRALDGWGLPIGGHARAAALGDRVDPLIDPAGWDAAPVAPADPTPVQD